MNWSMSSQRADDRRPPPPRPSAAAAAAPLARPRRLGRLLSAPLRRPRHLARRPDEQGLLLALPRVRALKARAGRPDGGAAAARGRERRGVCELAPGQRTHRRHPQLPRARPVALRRRLAPLPLPPAAPRRRGRDDRLRRRQRQRLIAARRLPRAVRARRVRARRPRRGVWPPRLGDGGGASLPLAGAAGTESVSAGGPRWPFWECAT
mmetsp:Transcript_6454/g.18572  ORF Transcript_6454/g.18572 Transcript_6454/m.18572 type:complete len:208 (+) Transcript_6454:746-1369(+)